VIIALHKQNIDLRSPNIPVINEEAILVDFEWCGTHSVDRYPVTMGTEISWPDGASLALYSCNKIAKFKYD
jgi:hypothetical protein